jgi:hypothetical protein
MRRGRRVETTSTVGAAVSETIGDSFADRELSEYPRQSTNETMDIPGSSRSLVRVVQQFGRKRLIQRTKSNRVLARPIAAMPAGWLFRPIRLARVGVDEPTIFHFLDDLFVIVRMRGKATLAVTGLATTDVGSSVNDNLTVSGPVVGRVQTVDGRCHSGLFGPIGFGPKMPGPTVGFPEGHISAN